VIRFRQEKKKEAICLEVQEVEAGEALVLVPQQLPLAPQVTKISSNLIFVFHFEGKVSKVLGSDFF
jgi:hypothetical protein